MDAAGRARVMQEAQAMAAIAGLAMLIGIGFGEPRGGLVVLPPAVVSALMASDALGSYLSRRRQRD